MLVENEALAKSVSDIFVRQIGDQRAWRVTWTVRMLGVEAQL